MSVLDEVTFNEIIRLEIQGWIVDLKGIRMDAALNELDLIASRTPFANTIRPISCAHWIKKMRQK